MSEATPQVIQDPTYYYPDEGEALGLVLADSTSAHADPVDTIQGRPLPVDSTKTTKASGMGLAQ